MHMDNEQDRIESFFKNSLEDEYIYGLKVIKKLDDVKIKGVWALLGKRDEKSNWICLQAGRSKYMYEEIRLDIIYMKSQPNLNGKEIDYINQCGKKVTFEDGFEIKSFPDVREQVYSYIGNKYVDLTFVLVYDATNDKSDDKRKAVEQYFAYSTEALYWKNGGPFTKPTDIDLNKKIDQIKLEISEKDRNAIDCFINNSNFAHRF